MVEMMETAYILRHATSRSLVLMDEIGRGTSTFDGLSLAWACAIHLAQQVKAFSLFATHYFELTALPQSYPGVTNVHLDATEYGDKLVFLHAVKPGPASQSYGIQVARLAGIPPQVIGAANQKLSQLEAERHVGNPPDTGASEAASPIDFQQTDMFQRHKSAALEALSDLDVDSLSPRLALEKLYELKEML